MCCSQRGTGCHRVLVQSSSSSKPSISAEFALLNCTDLPLPNSWPALYICSYMVKDHSSHFHSCQELQGCIALQCHWKVVIVSFISVVWLWNLCLRRGEESPGAAKHAMPTSISSIFILSSCQSYATASPWETSSMLQTSIYTHAEFWFDVNLQIEGWKWIKDSGLFSFFFPSPPWKSREWAPPPLAKGHGNNSQI